VSEGFIRLDINGSQGIEQAVPEAHIGRMRCSAFRRFVVVLMGLAFLASLQVAVMPAATASPASHAVVATQLAAQSNPDGCKGCGQKSMTAGECIAICGSLQVLTGQEAPSTSLSTTDSWTWLTETLSTTSVQPDHSPPRL
jgi:hypothetical protein